MAMSDEEINALNESLRELTDTMKIMTDTFASVANQSKTVSDNLNKTSTSAKNADTNINNMAKATIRSKGALDQFSESTEEATKRQQAYKDAQASGIQATLGFADALISTERGFAKFSGALSAAGDAAMELGKSQGPVGEVLGRIVKAGTIVGEKYLEQADTVFKARNEMFRFAGASSIGSNELLDMGQKIGFTSNQLDSIVKPLKSMGPTLLSLGNSAGEGSKRFLEIGAVSEETRKRFIRLGVMPEELLQSQADYINLQRLSGNQASLRLKTDKQIQEESLEYAESLKVLSELTGEDAETIKKQQEAALNDYRFQAKMTQMNMEAAELEKSNNAEDRARAAEIRATAKNMQEGVAVAAALSPELADQAKSLILTGGNITEFTSNLAVAGVNTQEFARAMESGDPDAMLNFLQDVMEKTGDQAARFGEMVGYLSDDQLKSLGITQGSMELVTKYLNEGQSLTEAVAKIREGIETAGQEGTDPLADAQATLTTTQMELAVAFDNLLQETSPLMNGFNSATTASTALAIAAGAAAVALSALALKRGAGAIFGGGAGRNTPDTPDSDRSPRTGLWNRARSAAPRATGLVRGVAGIGAAYGVIEAGVSGLQTNRDITNRQEAGEISASEARRERGANYGGTAGTAAGTAGGAWAGAASGAALGTLLLPGIGTAIGGFIGAGLGAWAGGAAGEALGSTLGETIAASTSDNLEEEVQNLEMPGETNTPGTAATAAATATARSTPSVEIPWDAMRELASQTFDEKESENIATNIDLLKMFGEAMSSIPEIKPIVIDEGWFSDEIKMPWDIIRDFGEASLPEPDKIIKNVEVVQAFSNAAPTLAAISELKPIETGGMLSSLKMPWEVIQDFGNTELPTVKQIEDNQSIINAFANAVVSMSNISDIKRIETGIFGGAFSSLDMPWAVINDFGNTSLPTVEQITNNQSIINAFANAVVSMSNISDIKRIETGIFGGALSSLDMPWDVIQDFGDTELPTAEQVSNNTNVVKAFTDAVPTLVAMSELERVNIADGLRNNLVMPWHVIKDFGEVELPPAENVAKNTVVVKAFTDAVPTLAAMSELERINIGNGLFNNFAMPWDVINDFGNTSLPTVEQITNNQSIINAFANAVVDMSNIPEIKMIDTGIFGGILNSLDMPWEVINDFGNAELPTVKQIEDNQLIINAFTKAAADMTNIPEIKFSEESEDNLDRLTNKLKDFSKLNSSDILDNIAALSELSNLTNENQRIEQLQIPTTTTTIPSTPEQVTAAITPRTLNTVAANTVSTTTTSTATAATTAANNNVGTEMSDIMSLLSYKLDNVISLLETGVTIQDRILLESRS